MFNALMEMSKFCYKEWYKKDVKANLTREQKDAVLHRISDLTLESAIWLDRETNFIEQFPELKPYSHKPSISGLQLVAVMEEIFEELFGKLPEIPSDAMKRTQANSPASEQAPKPYMCRNTENRVGEDSLKKTPFSLKLRPLV